MKVPGKAPIWLPVHYASWLFYRPIASLSSSHRVRGSHCHVDQLCFIAAEMPGNTLELTNDAALESTPHALLPFLQTQSQNTLTRLYQRPSSCLSIFRSFFIPLGGNTSSDFVIQATSPFGEAGNHESSLAGILHCCCDYGRLGYPRA